jgi:beta-lactam-binding protein with PASTA domain
MLRRRRVTQYDQTPPPAGRYVEEEVVAPPPRRPLWWLWLVLLLALVIGGLAAAYFLTRSDGTKTRVPNVVGLRAPVAVQRLGQSGYPAITDYRVSPGARIGTVLSESPPPGTALKRGSQVTITVARGRSTVTVPNVVGLSDAQAFTRVQAVGLKGRAVTIASSQPKGRVVKQAPPGGTQIKKGSTVTLSVSKGPTLVTVPLVQGQTEAKAMATLRRLGFKVSITSSPGNQTKGTVISQQPRGGSRAAKGSVVVLTISSGPIVPSGTTTGTTTTGTTPGTTSKSGAIPNVVGKSQRDAFAILGNAGYKVDSSPVASTRPRGTVVTESPRGGTRASAKTKVRIGVALGSGPRETRTVPDVTGQAEDTARQTLILAGFTVRTVDQPATTPGDNGIVLDQRPAGSESAPALTQIVIYVGRIPTPSG